MLSLSLAKTEITNFLAGAVDTLSRQDSEIIEADAIHKELLDQISIAKGKLRQAERDATFQVAIVSDLQNDVNGLTQQYTKLEASLIFSKQEQERVGKLVKTAQAKLDTLSNEILSCESQLKGLQLEASKVTKSLKQAGKSDKVIREALANKELKLQEEKTNLKVQKADIKKDLLAKQQLQPKPAVPIKDRLKGYYQI
jgi:chromosome segregation ATPase